MAKKILTVGIDLASDEVAEAEFRSKTSLLDYDIVLFRPLINNFIANYTPYFQGKPSLGDAASFQLKECCEHWRREIRGFVDSGKTIIVFLPPLLEVYVDSGKREYSGTGRSQKVTTVVDLLSNYSSLPADLSPVNATGSSIKISNSGFEFIGPYWRGFGEESQYKVIIRTDCKNVCLSTRNGDKPVGAVLKSKSSSGALVLLPDIDFDKENFSEEKDGLFVWTEAAAKFSARLISAVVAVDNSLQSSGEVTPEPQWANKSDYSLEIERSLRAELLSAERGLEEAQRRKEEVLERLKGAGALRGLLYEKGKPLESAVIMALRLLGFEANNYKDGASEFDVVFECSDGRLLGEAEGKDSKAVNIDKLRQLSMNIHEYLLRDDVSRPAKGILFGNGFRLTDPSERAIQFTEKCISASEAASVGLISTSDLYNAVQYLADHNNEEYAESCRKVILNTNGIVNFPDPPVILESEANIKPE